MQVYEISTILSIDIKSDAGFFSDDLLIAIADYTSKTKVYVIIQDKTIQHIFADNDFVLFLTMETNLVQYMNSSVDIVTYIPSNGKFSHKTLSNLMKIVRDCEFVDITDELFFMFTYNSSVIGTRSVFE